MAVTGSVRACVFALKIKKYRQAVFLDTLLMGHKLQLSLENQTVS